MARGHIRMGADIRPWLDLLDAHEFPNEAAEFALDEVLLETNGYIAARIPVDTGALLGSGRLSSEVANRSEWHGTITYGGFSPGYQEVTYAPQAIYHARSFDGVEQFNDRFEEAMGAGVRAYGDR